MISLHVTIFNAGNGDQFKVMSQGDDEEELVEVTDQYEVAAIQTPEGQTGFAVLQRTPAAAGSASAPGSESDRVPDQGEG